MKMVKAIRQQAATAERVAVNTADTYVADQMRALAQAFKIQAEIIKKNKKRRKNELLDKSEVPTR
jgi:G3E family GTPase